MELVLFIIIIESKLFQLVVEEGGDFYYLFYVCNQWLWARKRHNG